MNTNNTEPPLFIGKHMVHHCDKRCKHNKKRCTTCNVLRNLNYFRKLSQRAMKKRKHSSKINKIKYLHFALCLYCEYKKSAEKRNLEFTLTSGKFYERVNRPCHYCGKFWNNQIVSGLDRKDNSVGYILGNVVPCCQPCNFLKSNLSCEEFIYRVGIIYDYFHNNIAITEKVPFKDWTEFKSAYSRKFSIRK